MSDQLGPYEIHAKETLEPLRIWRERNFGFLTPGENNDLKRLMEGVTRRAKAQDQREDSNV